MCLQLNDTVPFRYHWPTASDLRVNNMQYRVYSRAAHLKLGANQRDEAANIGILCQPGVGWVCARGGLGAAGGASWVWGAVRPACPSTPVP